MHIDISDLIVFAQNGRGNNGGGGVGNTGSCPIQLVNDLIFLYQTFNAQLLWLYPTTWSLIIVRKIFFV